MSNFSKEFISTSSRDHSLVDSIHKIFAEAAEHNYSDLHFESQPNDTLLVRARYDGALRDIASLNHFDAYQLVEKIRARAKLSNVDYRAPQSGKFVQVVGDTTYNVRVSIINTDRDDVSIVLRLQNSSNSGLPLDKIGMTKLQQEIFYAAVMENDGLVLNTGPTGSGKTTTLYAAVKLRNNRETKVITIEDPIEYTQLGPVQIEVGEGTGKTFASVLREVLRQDPDVVLVGEMRDAESALTACQAAQTGHLVLSTLHTNSAPETISRLLLMGVPDYIIESAMRLFIAQRLIRKPCPHCQEEVAPTERERLWFPKMKLEAPDRVIVTHGCSACGGKGYSGRFPIFEMLLPTRELLQAIPDPAKIRAAAAEQPQFQTLAQSAFSAVLEHRATLSEIERLRLIP